MRGERNLHYRVHTVIGDNSKIGIPADLIGGHNLFSGYDYISGRPRQGIIIAQVPQNMGIPITSQRVRE